MGGGDDGRSQGRTAESAPRPPNSYFTFQSPVFRVRARTGCEGSVAPQIYNQYTITPLLNLGIPLHKVHQLGTAALHAIKSLNKITKTRHKTQFNNNNNSDNGGSGRGVTGRAAGFRRARRRPDHMADNPPDPH